MGLGVGALPPAHLPRALLAASEDVTYNGVVCMRKKAPGSTSVGTESVWEVLVQACASRYKEWVLGKRKLSSFRLGIEIEFHCFVEWTLIWRFLSTPHPISRTLHYMGRACFSFFFFLLFFLFFCPLRISLCRMAGFVKLPPPKFLQLCIFRLGICELAKSGLPIATLFTFEAIRVKAPEKC